MAVNVITIPRGKADGSHRTVGARWPEGAPVLTLQADLAEADQCDPTKEILVRIEVSDDGARSWRTWGGFTWAGSATRNQREGFPVATQPSFGMSAPPAGTLVRVRVEPSGSPEVGWIVRGL
jgi:hypothetical protein